MEGVVAASATTRVGTGLVTVRPYLDGALGTPGRCSTLTRFAAASLGRSVADLHAISLCHGSLRPGNVLFDVSGRPVLTDPCLAAVWRGRWAKDGTPPLFSQSAVASDVRALARLLFDSLEEEAVREIRARLERIRNLPERELARHGVDGVTCLLEEGTARQTPARHLVGRRAALAAAAASTGLVAGALAWRSTRDASGPTRVEVGRPAATRPPTARPRVVTSGPDLIVVAGDGHRSTYRLGSPGDTALAGDWFCRGEVLPGDYRPATGTVYEFTAWPVAGAPVAAARQVATRVRNGIPRVVRQGGCDGVVVTAAATSGAFP